MVKMNRIQVSTYISLVGTSVFFFLLLLESAIVSAETIYVDDSGSGDYTSIQQAVDAANVSDIIHVYSGTYDENIIIDKSIELHGDDQDSTFIRGVVSASDHTLKITANDVTVKDLSISNELRESQDFPCVFVDSATGFILDSCILSEGERGILLQYAINTEIKNCMIQNNDQKGLKLYFADDCLIHDNQIQNNGDGMYLYGSDGNMIYKNEIKSNGYGILVSASFDNDFYENEFSSNSAENAEDSTAAGSNSWSYNQKGNYWDDYQDYDSNGDGIGDNPYLISGGDSVDAYPLGIFLIAIQEPVAYIDYIHPSTATEGDSVSFEGHGIDEDGYIVDWQWVSSIDGIIHSSSADFSTSFLSVGTHIIKFRVKDDDDQWSSYDESTVVIELDNEENQAPTATIVTVDPTETDEDEEIYFHGFGSDSDGMITAYQWSSNKDGVLSSESTFTTSTLSSGTHTISFKVKDNGGTWSSAKTITVKVRKNTTVEFIAPVAQTGGPYSGTVNKSILFDASDSYDSDGTIESYSWDFGDGKSGTGKIISHTYTQYGNYTLFLTVIDDDEVFSDETTTVTILKQTTSNSSNTSSSTNSSSSTNNQNNDQPIPGFELLALLIGIISIIFCLSKKQ